MSDDVNSFLGIANEAQTAAVGDKAGEPGGALPEVISHGRPQTPGLQRWLLMDAETRVLEGADEQAAVTAILRAGDEIDFAYVETVSGRKYCRVALRDGSRGFIAGNAQVRKYTLARLGQAEAKVRGLPSPGAAEIRRLTKGDAFLVMGPAAGESGGFIPVRCSDGLEGYIDARVKVVVADQRPAAKAKHTPEHDMVVGGLWCVGGIIVTAVSYQSVAQSGGSYVVTWGAILFGGIQFLKGAGGLLGGTSVDSLPLLSAVVTGDGPACPRLERSDTEGYSAAISHALRELRTRHKLRKEVLALDAGVPPTALFEKICGAAAGKPRVVSWRLRRSAARLLGAMNLGAEQRERAELELGRATRPPTLLRTSLLRTALAWAVMVVAAGTVYALNDTPTPGEGAAALGLRYAEVSAGAAALMLPIAGLVLYVASGGDQWDAMRAAAWEALGGFGSPEAIAPLLRACPKQVGSTKSQAAAVLALNKTIGDLSEAAISKLDSVDPRAYDRLLQFQPLCSLAWLRVLSIHGSKSSLEAIEKVIAKTPDDGIRAKAREVAEVITARLARESEKLTLLRSSGGSVVASDTLLRTPSSAAGSIGNLLIAAGEVGATEE